MKLVGLFFAVGLVAILQMYVAVPIGLSGDLDRGSIIVAAWVGSMIGVVTFVYLGEAITAWITGALRRVLRRPPKELEPEDEEPKEPGFVRRNAGRFGEPFLGVVGPLTIGGWAAAMLGTGIGLSKGKLIFWLAVGQAIVIVAYVWGLKAATQ